MSSPRSYRLGFLARAVGRLGYLGFIEPFLRTAKRKICRVISALEASSVLEVGCGACTQARALARLGLRVTALDVSDRMFPLRRSLLPENLTVLQADGRSLPFPDHAFDVALASMALHEMPPEDRRPVLGEMLRVVRPGGTIVIMDFHFEEQQSTTLAEILIRLIEWGAGREHHAHFLDFVAHGGIPPLARAAGCTVVRRQSILAERGGIFELTVLP